MEHNDKITITRGWAHQLIVKCPSKFTLEATLFKDFLLRPLAFLHCLKNHNWVPDLISPFLKIHCVSTDCSFIQQWEKNRWLFIAIISDLSRATEIIFKLRTGDEVKYRRGSIKTRQKNFRKEFGNDTHRHTHTVAESKGSSHLTNFPTTHWVLRACPLFPGAYWISRF